MAEQKKREENESKVAELERMEQEMMAKLKETKHKQQCAHNEYTHTVANGCGSP